MKRPRLLAILAATVLATSLPTVTTAYEPYMEWTLSVPVHDKVHLSIGEVDGRTALIAVENHTQVSLGGEFGEELLTMANLDGGYSQVLTWDTSSPVNLSCPIVVLSACSGPGRALLVGSTQTHLAADGGTGGSVVLHASLGPESVAYDVASLALGFVLPLDLESYFVEAAIALAPEALEIASLILQGQFDAASDAFGHFLNSVALYVVSTWPDLFEEEAHDAMSWLIGKAKDLAGLAIMPIKGGINTIKTATVFANLGAAWVSGSSEDQVQVGYTPALAGIPTPQPPDESPDPTSRPDPSIAGAVPAWCLDVLGAGARLIPGATNLPAQFEGATEFGNWTCFGSVTASDRLYRLRSYDWKFKGSAASGFNAFVADACAGANDCVVFRDLGPVSGLGDRAHQLRASLGNAVLVDWIVILDGKRLVGFGCRDCADGPAFTLRFARAAFPLLKAP